MSVRKSTSEQFRCFNSQFSRDANTLEKSIRDLKVKAGELPKHDADVEVIKIHDSEKDDVPERLASRAKDLRGMTEQRFAEVIDGWRKQNEGLQRELDMYQNQQRVSADRVQKRNTEIKNLRNENEKLTSLLRKCEDRINQLFDVKEREDREKQRANKLADQLYDHKKMIGDLQVQLKEAEKLLATTKHERNNLLVENHSIKQSNADLKRDLVAAERDTQETRAELELIEGMVQSIDQVNPHVPKYGSQACPKVPENFEVYGEDPIEPREAPSALTALNIMRDHHQAGISELSEELRALRHKETQDKDEIRRLENELHGMR